MLRGDIVNKDIFGSKTQLFDSKVFRIALITILVVSIALLAYFTGGAARSYLHLIYIPVILSAYFWRIRGGMYVAIIAGVIVGPFMPMSVSEGIMQSPSNWMIRLIIITIVGFVIGYILNKIDELNKKADESLFISPITGMYNINKLMLNLKERMDKGEEFTIISIKLTNLEQIAKYVDQTHAREILSRLINEILDIYGKDMVYTSGYDEINLIILPGCSYLKECRRIIKRYLPAYKINQFMFRITMKIGIYLYDGLIDESPLEVYNKARIAYEQGTPYETGIYYYDREFGQSRKEFFNISGALLEAISNKELYLVYQPKINIKTNRIVGVEVLTRWDRGEEKPVGPGVFIKLAEETGFIKEITRFVLHHSFHQIADWNEKDIVLNFSINFTADELLENHFLEWERKVTESEELDLSKLEIEITERVFAQNSERILERINELRAKGIKIAIDDFGTGANSLMMMAQFPFDQIKIDKYFISHLEDLEIREIIKTIIGHAHNFGREIIAEGVETEEQLHILKELDCDIIQGYYYSKPLRPEEFEQYYFQFARQEKAISQG
jgi:EAL domain-containing protein (putative c-di-GMP-specific phosphodiesterase class I)/GGDEF domain-containing protein